MSNLTQYSTFFNVLLILINFLGEFDKSEVENQEIIATNADFFVEFAKLATTREYSILSSNSNDQWRAKTVFF